jgi:hypothetical protein
MRERNAKRVYIRSPQDDRSPWLLFGDLANLRREVTKQFYRHSLGRLEDYTPRPADEVQQFIDAEHAENTYDARYHGLYDDRFINPGELKNLPDSVWSREKLAAWLSSWPAANLQQRMEAFRGLQSEYSLLRGLQSGEYSIKGKTFPFRGKHYTAQDVERLFAQVDKELDSDLEALRQMDRDVFLAHWSLARCLDQGDGGQRRRESDLLQRYRFHGVLQGLLQGMLGEQARLRAILDVISNNPQLTEEDFNHVAKALQEIRETLTGNLEDAKSFASPALTNVPAGSTLYSLIVDRGDTALPSLSGNTITGEWLGKLMTRLEGVLSRLKRVHFKSLGSLLACQENLEGEWKPALVEPGDQPPPAVVSTGVGRTEPSIPD